MEWSAKESTVCTDVIVSCPRTNTLGGPTDNNALAGQSLIQVNVRHAESSVHLLWCGEQGWLSALKPETNKSRTVHTLLYQCGHHGDSRCKYSKARHDVKEADKNR